MGKSVDDWTVKIPFDITLRDLFAGMAMQGNVASGGDLDGIRLDMMSKWCYAVADSMLAEREKRK